MNGKQIRLNRISVKNKYLIVPMDHGITINSIGPLYDFEHTANKIIDSGPSAIIVHKGMVRFLPTLKNTGLIIHLSASTEMYCEVKKDIVCTIEEAISLGADGVSIHVNLGNRFEKEMLYSFSKISADCQKYQMPLLVMMYIRDESNHDISTPEKVKHGIRIVSELGADIIKISVRWDSPILTEIVKDSLIPVVIAGGEIKEKESFLMQTHQYMKSGISGICYGRNVFLAKDINDFLLDLKPIVFTD